MKVTTLHRVLILAIFTTALILARNWWTDDPLFPRAVPVREPVENATTTTTLGTIIRPSLTQPLQTPPAPPPATPQPSTVSPSDAPSGLSGFYRREVSTLPTINAERFIVADVERIERFAQLSANARWPLASMTKLMTAIVASQTFSPDTTITIGADDFPPDSSENPQYVKEGEQYSLQDALRIMLLASSNEATEAIASNIDRSEFIARMNAQAKEWEMTDTYFSDPTGLSVSNQSTLTDLQKLAFHLYHDYPKVLAITRLSQARVREVRSGVGHDIMSINNFAGRTDFIGGKTGHTDEAGENLLSIFSYGDAPVLIVVMGTQDRFGETRKLLEWFHHDFAPLQT